MWSHLVILFLVSPYACHSMSQDKPVLIHFHDGISADNNSTVLVSVIIALVYFRT